MSENVESPRRGRPVVANSARQSKIAKWEAMKAAGLVVRRGRPSKMSTVVAVVALEITNNNPEVVIEATPTRTVKKKPLSDNMANKIANAMEKSNRKKTK
jgi:hypothetical protein